MENHCRGSSDLFKLIPTLRKRGKKPYPIERYNYKSDRYSYVYNESYDKHTFWHARLDGILTYSTRFGVMPRSWDYYSFSEEKCAREVYKMIKKYLKRITKEDNSWTNKYHRRHINWQKWLDNYEFILNNKKSETIPIVS